MGRQCAASLLTRRLGIKVPSQKFLLSIRLGPHFSRRGSFFFRLPECFFGKANRPTTRGNKKRGVQKKWSFSVVGLDGPSRPSNVSAIPVRKLCAAAARFRLTFSLSPGVTDRNWCSRLFFSPTMACLSAPFFNRVCAHGILHFRRQCRLFSLSGGIFVTREKKGDEKGVYDVCFS